MKILSIHNSYQQPGGEDEVFRQEAQLLEGHGHRVIRYQAHNDELIGKGPLQLLKETIFNSTAYRRVSALIQQERPNVMHVHNTFPLLSPAVYYAAFEAGVPTVQTLHNYRLLCPAGNMFRDNHVCERCLHTAAPWPAMVHGCYRGRSASAVAAGMLTVHRLLRTYNKITTYVALSDFACSKFIEAGIPKRKIVVKPNFIDPDPGRGSGAGGYCLFVGRLTHEKGVRSLLDAWTQFAPPMDLEIAGDGELAPEVARAAEQCSRIHWHGRLEKERLYGLMKNAAALIVPSTWFEPFGMVVVEAFAMGIPVIASRMGALSSIVEHRRTGLHFAAGDARDLAEQVTWLRNHPSAARVMREQARLEYETHYTGDRNYEMLMNIYDAAILRHHSGQCDLAEEEDGAEQTFESSLGLTQITGTTSTSNLVAARRSKRLSPDGKLTADVNS